jgi:hypothetical protein
MRRSPQKYRVKDYLHVRVKMTVFFIGTGRQLGLVYTIFFNLLSPTSLFHVALFLIQGSAVEGMSHVFLDFRCPRMHSLAFGVRGALC